MPGFLSYRPTKCRLQGRLGYRELVSAATHVVFSKKDAYDAGSPLVFSVGLADTCREPAVRQPACSQV